MKVIGVIPARYHSTRFEGKALAPLGGRPLIQHVYENASRATLLDELLVATDDERIARAVYQVNGRVAMTSPDHPSGTDRVAEAVRDIEADVVVNIQGDEPFIAGRAIDQAVEPFRNHPALEMSTLMREISDEEVWRDPNVVKVVVDRSGYALYFSRSLIPYPRRQENHRAYEHIGLYAYSRAFLLRFAALEPGTLEFIEGLEQLRALEHGHRILTIDTDHHVGLSVDTPADLEKAEAFLARRPMVGR
jgi:3-deoxy-manno-octulosonate cytidylyltransferase (CMP-KDO synthetase)